MKERKRYGKAKFGQTRTGEQDKENRDIIDNEKQRIREREEENERDKDFKRDRKAKEGQQARERNRERE